MISTFYSDRPFIRNLVKKKEIVGSKTYHDLGENVIW